MKIRIAITITMLFLYGMAFNIYIYELLRLPHRNAALMYNYITFGMLLFLVADWKMGFVSHFHSQFNLIGFLSLMVNFILIILIHHQIIADPYLFLLFNSGLFIVTACVFISAIRTKIFIE